MTCCFARSSLALSSRARTTRSRPCCAASIVMSWRMPRTRCRSAQKKSAAQAGSRRRTHPWARRVASRARRQARAARRLARATARLPGSQPRRRGRGAPTREKARTQTGAMRASGRNGEESSIVSPTESPPRRTSSPGARRAVQAPAGASLHSAPQRKLF